MSVGIVLGIVGSRHFTDYQMFQAIMEKFCNNLVINKIVSGGARGADALARKYAFDHHIPLTEHIARWDKHGKAAGPIRNALIIEDCDVLLALVAPDSKGTLDSIAKAEKKGIQVLRVNI